MMWGSNLLAQTAEAAGTEVEVMDGSRMLLAMVLTVVVVVIFQRGLAREGLPAGFASPWRAVGASTLLAAFLFLGVFVPMMLIGQPLDIDIASLSRLELFSSQFLMLAVLAGWALFAFGEPLPRSPDRDPRALGEPMNPEGMGRDQDREDDAADADPRRDWPMFFGLRTSGLLTELRVGVLAGAGAWAAVIATMMVAGLLLSGLTSGDEAGATVSPLIVLVAGLPVFWKLLLSLAAGVVEEIFFRGFLQPRMGITLSTVCFVLGHAAYGQPMMFVGLTVLSLLYAFLVRWRGNVWAAIVAHTLFDAVQLLVVVPTALTATGAGLG